MGRVRGKLPWTVAKTTIEVRGFFLTEGLPDSQSWNGGIEEVTKSSMGFR